MLHVSVTRYKKHRSKERACQNLLAVYSVTRADIEHAARWLSRRVLHLEAAITTTPAVVLSTKCCHRRVSPSSQNFPRRARRAGAAGVLRYVHASRHVQRYREKEEEKSQSHALE